MVSWQKVIRDSVVGIAQGRICIRWSANKHIKKYTNTSKKKYEQTKVQKYKHNIWNCPRQVIHLLVSQQTHPKIIEYKNEKYKNTKNSKKTKKQTYINKSCICPRQDIHLLVSQTNTSNVHK